MNLILFLVMFLLHILDFIDKIKYLNYIKKNLYKKKLNYYKLLILKLINLFDENNKLTKNLFDCLIFNLNIFFYIYKKNSISKNILKNTVSFVINILSFSTNSIINIIDIKGNLKLSLSAGMVKLKGKQKTKEPTAMLQILENIITKTTVLSKAPPVIVMFNKVSSYTECLVTEEMKKYFFLNVIRSYNLKPHNGCRPRKLKRKKEKMAEWFKAVDCKSIGIFPS